MNTSTTNQTGSGKRSDSALQLSPEEIGPLLRKHELRITIVGLGRIGLPTAAVFAEAGARVIGLDISADIVKQVNAGECRLMDEPGLEEVVKRTVESKNLGATTKPEAAIPGSHFVIICVPTPVDATKFPDYHAVETVSKTVGSLLTRGSIVIVESTVGPGVVENLVGSTIEHESGLKAGQDFGLVSCPERSDPGSIMKNMHAVPRIIGCSDAKCAALVAALYTEGLGVKVVNVSNPKTANAVKLTENLFRDVNIALANEFALLYEKFDIDTVEVINACATKYNFMPHYPGAGVGGPCLPSNSYYLITEGLRVGNIPYLIRLAREINDRMPDHMVELTSEALNEVGKTIRGSKIAVLGLTYKPGVKDIQLTPVEHIINRLREMGAKVEAYDPMLAGETVMGIVVHRSVDGAVDGADCILVGTAHEEFKSLSLASLSKLASSRAAIVDGRSIFDPAEAKRMGFAFRGVGRVTAQ
jgi:nucleotide sugar dehydrogenase